MEDGMEVDEGDLERRSAMWNGESTPNMVREPEAIVAGGLPIPADNVSTDLLSLSPYTTMCEQEAGTAGAAEAAVDRIQTSVSGLVLIPKPGTNHPTSGGKVWTADEASKSHQPDLQLACNTTHSAATSSVVEPGAPVVVEKPPIECYHPFDGGEKSNLAHPCWESTKVETSGGLIAEEQLPSTACAHPPIGKHKQHASADPHDVLSPSSRQIMAHPVTNTDDRAFQTSATGAKLFHLMEIRSDRQDMSTVEKIILPRGQIISFCQAMNADSARESREGELSLKFAKLDGNSLNVVGSYGSKVLLIECLESCNAIGSDDQIHAKMRGDSLLPGLYALLHASTLIVFYWHHGPDLPNASRKDISCSFVRYLVDLCDSVFILLEGSGAAITEALKRGNLAKTVRQARNRKMRIEKRKATENKLQVVPGFRIHLNICDSAQWENTSSAGFSTRPLICEGSRCGFLSYTLNPPQTLWRSHCKSVRLQDISPGTQIFDGQPVDFGCLENKDLSLFLQCSGCKVGTNYVRQLQELEKRKENLKSAQENQQDREQRLTLHETRVGEAISDFISECLKTTEKFAWEEALWDPELVDLKTMPPVPQEGLCTPPELVDLETMPPAPEEAVCTSPKLVDLETMLPAPEKALCAPPHPELVDLETMLPAPEKALFTPREFVNVETMLPVPEEAMQRDGVAKGVVRMIRTVSSAVGSLISKSRKKPRNDLRAKHEKLSQKKIDDHIFTGFGRFDNKKHMFIFPGNKVRLLLPTGHMKDPQIYSIEHASGGMCSSYGAGPLCHNDRLLLRSVKSRQTSLEMTFRAKDRKNDGPLLTHTVLSSSTCSLPGVTSYLLEVVEEDCELGGLENWVASEVDAIVDRFLPQLLKKAFLLSSVVGCDQSGIWTETKIQAVLKLPDDRFLEDVVNSHPDETKDEIKARWVELSTGAWNATPLSDVVVRQCSTMYRSAREGLCSTLQSLFNRNMKGLLETWIHLEDCENLKALDHELEQERERVLSNILESPSQAQRNQCKVRLQSCHIAELNKAGSHPDIESNVWKYLGKSGDPANLNLCLKYDEEFSEKETKQWRVHEISTSKPDLENLGMDPNLTFTPTQQVARNIWSLNPCTEQLLKVLFLKTGQYLVFVRTSEAQGQAQVFLSPPAGRSLPVHTMNRGFDLIAFDEETRFLAMYDKCNVMIKSYRFEEGYKHLAFSGAEVCLRELGVASVTWMKFIPGRAEVVFMDSDHKVRVFEMGAPGMVRVKDIQLPGPFVSAEVTRQGPCLLVFNAPAEGDQNTVQTTLRMEVYWIDQSMSHVSTTAVHTFEKRVPSNFATAVHRFGPQEHLLLFTEDDPRKVQSLVLNITSASEEYKLLSDDASKVGGPQQVASSLALDYLYHVYEKFATSPPLVKQSRTLSLYIVLNEQGLKEECLKYLDSSFMKLQIEKGKNFRGMDKKCLVCESIEVSLVLSAIARDAPEHGKRGLRTRSMGDWVRQLLCLVPIQIARAENNCLRPLADGLELSADVDYDNTISLASLFRFGFYDAVFESWRNKPLRIISSMGKQSSGKSYLLNHLSGSLLDVSGGRCTDGVYMTVRISDDDDKSCMYVLLDFEGVGTFERSEQEDMLLSLLNAAISNITIYNKKDFNLDRETETVFEQFQNGVSLVKDDEKFFSGLFYMAVKDVGEDDVEDLEKELMTKIQKMLANSSENFLTRMYGGRVNLGLMAAFDTPHYYTNIDQIYEIVNDPKLETSYADGRSFSTDLKLLIAQICAKDWASTDSKRMELRVYLIHAHLETAITMGRLDAKGNEVNLANFDSQEEIEDGPIRLGNNIFPVHDTGLKLKQCDDGGSIGNILTCLKILFQDVVKRSGENDEGWHAAFIEFVESLIDRRQRRVLEWISCNAQKFEQHEEIQRIKLEARARCTEVKQKLSVCCCTCECCFLRCTKEKGHDLGHSCLGDHMCSQSCSYCVRENNLHAVDINKCSDAAGHQGSHDCRSKSHTCQEMCIYEGEAANCNIKCAGTVGHSGKHLCNSREHKCSQRCSLGSCNNPCVSPFEVADHFPHFCHEKFCPYRCSMEGCNRRCESKDHFHEQMPNVVHCCGLAHSCPKKCEARGNCAVQQDLVRTTKTFISRYGSFEYEHIAEQSGIRKPCCIEIPPFQTTHQGPHSHTLKENVVHLCDIKCRACGYFCTEPIGHGGPHNTVHGNMSNTKFAAESQRIEIEDRVYAWGESGSAEMCNMHCKSRGRGHIHLMLCPTNNSRGVCYSRVYPDGVQHETTRYGPHFHVAKDEMTHAAYWKHMRFVDPCTHEDQALFKLCGHECGSEVHKPKVGSGTSGEKRKLQKSFCTLQVWHDPITDEERRTFTQGYVTHDGHHMNCKHEWASNVVFVIDRSYSMADTDITPKLVRLQQSHNNRLGCVFEAIQGFIRTRRSLLLSLETDLASVVLFNSEEPALTAVELEDMDEAIVNKLLIHHPSGGTCFSTGLEQAKRILLESKVNGDQRPPVVIFFSDGSNIQSDDDDALGTVQSMKSLLDERLRIFTVNSGTMTETSWKGWQIKVSGEVHTELGTSTKDGIRCKTPAWSTAGITRRAAKKCKTPCRTLAS